MQEPPSPATRLPVDAVADRIATCVEENRVTLICGA
jgi:HrpA-like RNA helicase